MTTIPSSQIADAHRLTADGQINLFQLTPSVGSGTIFFKSDNSVTWQSNVYEGLPMEFTGDGMSAQTGSAQPRLTIGNQNVDISKLKPIIFDGSIDGALIVRKLVLLDDLLNDRNVATTYYYRVRRVESYSRNALSLQLGAQTDALSFSMPFRSYTPPAFPAVMI